MNDFDKERLIYVRFVVDPRGLLAVEGDQRSRLVQTRPCVTLHKTCLEALRQIGPDGGRPNLNYRHVCMIDFWNL